MAVEAKQREWVWEFFLNNSTDAWMIQELMNALPFPNENQDLKKLLLLRSLSLQGSAGIIDELTLDTFRGLGELRRVSEARRDGRALPGNLERQRVSNKNARKTETVVGSRDWMEGRALRRSVGSSDALEEPIKESGQDKEVPNVGKSITFSRDFTESEFIFRPGELATKWELELAVMVELTVKHLRGESPDRELFEHAVIKYWGEIVDETEGWPAKDLLNMAKARNKIKSELWMVRKKPELLDDVVEKYTKNRLADMLKAHLDTVWAGSGKTFLEKVSIDVVDGKYKPINCNSQLHKKTGNSLEDGEVGGESHGKEQTMEKPWIRAARGRYSKSKEKLRKCCATWDLDDEDGGRFSAKLPLYGRDKGSIETHQVEGESNQQDRHHEAEDGVDASNSSREGGEGVSLSAGGGLGINSRSHKFKASANDGGVACVLGFEEPGGKKSVDGKELFGDLQEARRADAEDMKAASQMHRAKGTHEGVFEKENVVPPLFSKAVDPNGNPVWVSPPPWVAGSTALPVTDVGALGLTRKRKSALITDETDAAPQREEQMGSETVAAKNPINQGLDIAAIQRNLLKKQTALDAAVQDPLPKILMSFRAKSSLWKSNATARTLEREAADDIEESQPHSPAMSRCVRLPHPVTEHGISPLIGTKATAVNGTGPSAIGPMNGRQGRRKPRRWSDMEVDTLIREMGKYGKGRWKLILERNEGTFQGRTEVDLKDKWRNLERFEGIRE